VEELKEANPRIDPQTLHNGQKIIIPEKTKPAPPPEKPAEPKPEPKAEPKPAGKPPEPAPPSASSQESATPPPNLPPSERPELYLVKKGDTLFKISREFSVGVEDLKTWNKLADNTLRPGQTLRLKPFTPTPTPEPSPAPGPRPPEAPDPRVQAPSPPPEEPKPVPPPPAPEPKPAEKPPEPKPLPPPPEQPAPEPVLKESSYLFLKDVKAEIDRPEIKRNRWKYIVIHHSGTANGNAAIFDINHRKRGMENGLAYHFVIGNGVKDQSVDGGIEVGNRWKKQLQGGHVRSDALNEISIGICLVGDFESTRPTKKQIAALIELVTYLRDHCNTSRKPVVKMHRDINPMPTDCPGRYFPAKAMYKLFP
jgi:LysM repeat protein